MVAIGVTIVSGTEILTESHLKSEKKNKKLTNRRSRRRTLKKKEDEPGVLDGVKKKNSSEPP